MKLCGLTGGVGMGKSTAASFLLQLGARVVDTDDIARELVQPGEPALEEIKREFGAHMVSPAGDLKRDQLAKLVFGDESARKRLEGILHPRIQERWQNQINDWRREDCGLAVVVIPLLYETQAERYFEHVICVACSDAARQERLQARGWTGEQIKQRIEAQMPMEKKIARSKYVVWTEGTRDLHRRQIEEILKKL